MGRVNFTPLHKKKEQKDYPPNSGFLRFTDLVTLSYLDLTSKKLSLNRNQEIPTHHNDTCKILSTGITISVMCARDQKIRKLNRRGKQ